MKTKRNYIRADFLIFIFGLFSFLFQIRPKTVLSSLAVGGLHSPLQMSDPVPGWFLLPISCLVSVGFWFAQQGSIFVFIGLIFYYVVAMARLDREFGVEED